MLTKEFFIKNRNKLINELECAESFNPTNLVHFDEQNLEKLCYFGKEFNILMCLTISVK